MDKKFELTNESKTEKFSVDFERTVYRIKALRDFADVKAGQLGGWVEKETNLSQEGNCFIYDDAVVAENARLSGNAVAKKHSQIFGNSVVMGSSQILDNGVVCDDAVIKDKAIVKETAMVRDNAVVGSKAMVSGRAIVRGNAMISQSANISGDSIVKHSSIISGRASVFGKSVVSNSAVVTGVAVLVSEDVDGNQVRNGENELQHRQIPEETNSGVFQKISNFIRRIIPFRMMDDLSHQKVKEKNVSNINIENALMKAKNEGRMEAVREVLGAAGLKKMDVSPYIVGKSYGDSLQRNEEQSKMIDDLKASKERYGYERYIEGSNDTKARIEGLQKDIQEIISTFAKGNAEVKSYYETPREDRNFMTLQEYEKYQKERGLKNQWEDVNSLEQEENLQQQKEKVQRLGRGR